eukprot:m.157957 g.157957  ORF g.157957 m.157957 type:complete len:99 (+) comp15168_c4_seq24:677-973(+)
MCSLTRPGEASAAAAAAAEAAAAVMERETTIALLREQVRHLQDRSAFLFVCSLLCLPGQARGRNGARLSRTCPDGRPCNANSKRATSQSLRRASGVCG